MADEIHLEPFDEDSYYQDPAGFFARLRASRPVAPVRMAGRGRAWFITRDADVRAALADPRLANDVHHHPGGARQPPSEAAGGVHAHLLNTDPPVHTRLRRLVWKAFTPRRVAQLRPRAAEIAAGLLDEMEAAGGVTDLLDAYARPLPGAVLCELLGVPAADRNWISPTVAAYDKPGEADRVTRELAAYLTELIAAKRADPGDDLLSALALVRDDVSEDGTGEGLTDTEARSLAFQIIMGGFGTTVNLIGNGTLALLTHPEELARLRADPSLLPAAIEELLRFTNPLNRATDRFTTQDMTVGDEVIPAGEWVFVAISSANRDPDRFPDPDRLDLSRDTSGHLAFGHGIHYCLGASLARVEAEVALGALLARFPRLSLAVPPEELRWRPVSLMHGLESLPVRLT
ncbi:MAG: cytochrome [Actinomycetia bacterium]|nr:cytochrome [Actinomycetes bacterium]